jgi:DNA-binding FadR family transcriptional regulator
MRQAGDSRKLGEILAETIEDEIFAAGWPVGTVIGSESELLEKYGVSRAVFREAIRIVDHHGVAEMRRGPGGGLVVSSPDLDAVVRAVSIQLRYEHIKPDQVIEARRALEVECARLAARRISTAGRQQLEAFLAAEEQRINQTRRAGRRKGDLPSHDFHLLLADLTGNPAMRLFVQMINLALGEQAPKSPSLTEVASEVHRIHARIAEAVLAGDADTAARRMDRHLAAVMDYFEAPRSSPRRLRAASGASR